MKNLPLVRIPPSIFLQLRKGSPWVFRDSLPDYESIRNLLPEGGWVRISASKNPGGLALFDPDNAIALRIFDSSHEEIPVKPFLHYKISSAISIRSPIDRSITNGMRLIHGENDFLPGLVADIYDRLLVFRPDTAVWIPFLPVVTEYLSREVAFDASCLIYSGQSGWLEGEAVLPTEFLENSLRFMVDPSVGQKTGFFLDMRPNRKIIQQFSGGKNILNCFSYTGAFSVYARSGGAMETTNVDISSGAIEAAKENHRINGYADEKTGYVAQDAFEYLETIPEISVKKVRTLQGPFDMIILDPPAFAHSKEKIESGIASYRKLNQTALARLGSGQYLATASCSSRISAEQFLGAVSEAASETGRKLRLVYSHGAGEDHPVALNSGIMPYLKFYLFMVS
ncbi:MAG: class I SAM-dependent rRNA methyltransferase [Spirochaetia bacterium]|nr:class I SAM-dependent rRNA methyltransferase [Spirochaetia bacterium]